VTTALEISTEFFFPMGKLNILTFFHKVVPQNLYKIHKIGQKRSQIKLLLL